MVISFVVFFFILWRFEGLIGNLLFNNFASFHSSGILSAIKFSLSKNGTTPPQLIMFFYQINYFTLSMLLPLECSYKQLQCLKGSTFFGDLTPETEVIYNCLRTCFRSAHCVTFCPFWPKCG